MNASRATAVAACVFAALCLLFFVQPFTGSFLVVALVAAVVALATFAMLRRTVA